MSEANKYMDDSFRKMSEEFKASYDSSFWEQAKVQLENSSLDDAFRQAADNVSSFASADIASESLADAFMADAFKDAAAKVAVTYDSEFWDEMSEAEAELNMDDAFSSASKKIKANYNPVYWGDANSALEEEGLHYEYNSVYWDEAKLLLDKADRRLFFAKWAGIAALLLLISTAGLKLGTDAVYTNTSRSFEKTVAPKNVGGTNNEALTNANDESLVLANEDLVQNDISSPQINETESNETIQSLISQETSVNSEVNERVFKETENEIIAQPSEEIISNDIIRSPEIILADVNVVDNSDAENSTELNNEIRERQSLVHIERIKTEQDQYNSENILANSMVEIDKIRLKPTHMLSLIGGLGLGKGFGVDPSYTMPRAYAGIEYLTRSFGKMKRFEFGGSLTIQGIREDGLIREKRTVRYLENTDSTSSWSKLKINDLLYVNANFLMNYRVSNKHILKFGVGVDHLLGVRSNMAYFIGGTKDATTEQQNIRTVNNNWGVENGILKNDLKFSLGYEFRLNHNLSVQSTFNYGVFDRTEDDFYKQNATFDNEMNVTLGIRYTFFNKI